MQIVAVGFSFANLSKDLHVQRKAFPKATIALQEELQRKHRYMKHQQLNKTNEQKKYKTELFCHLPKLHATGQAPQEEMDRLDPTTKQKEKQFLEIPSLVLGRRFSRVGSGRSGRSRDYHVGDGGLGFAFLGFMGEASVTILPEVSLYTAIHAKSFSFAALFFIVG